MNMTRDQADQIAQDNGCFAGLDVPYSKADYVIQNLYWDVTTSYRDGTRMGPDAILEASLQVDFYSPFYDQAWNLPLHTLKSPKTQIAQATLARKKAALIIKQLSTKGALDQRTQKLQDQINQVCQDFHQKSYLQTKRLLSDGKKVLTLGGDHSVSYGPIQAAAQFYGPISILHFDAHADLRLNYEGFTHSHASIMRNVTKLKDVKKLVQVGIRDVSPLEIDFIKQNKNKIHTFFDWDLARMQFEGISFKKQTDQILSCLGQNVYISFDIDALDPSLCPSTGTPVPGGLSYNQALYIIHSLKKHGKKVIGADVVEVAPKKGDQWDGNVGARIAWNLALAMAKE